MRAQKLDLKVDGKLGYDSNLYSRKNETESGSVRFGGVGTLSDQLQRASYTVSYKPVLFFYTRRPEATAMNHRASIDTQFIVTPRWNIGLVESFSRQERIRPEDSGGVSGGDGELITNRVAARSSYAFSQRLRGSAEASRSLVRYGGGDRDNSDRFAGRASLNYTLNPRTTVGFGGNMGYRWFEERQPLELATSPSPLDRCQPAPPGTRSLNYQVFGSIQSQLTRRTSLSLSGGPAQLRTSRYQCETDPNSPFFRIAKVDSSSFTWFASAQLTQQWEKVFADASFSRSEGLSGDSQNSSINTTVNAKLQWQAGRFWDFSMGGNWSLRESEGRGFGTTETQTFTVKSRIRRKLTERTSALIDFLYVNQSNQSEDIQTSDSYQAYRIFLGVEYRFAPIRF